MTAPDFPDVEETITASEVAMAKILAAYLEWPGEQAGDAFAGPMFGVWDSLIQAGLIAGSEATAAGDELLTRARRLGALP